MRGKISESEKAEKDGNRSQGFCGFLPDIENLLLNVVCPLIRRPHSRIVGWPICSSQRGLQIKQAHFWHYHGLGQEKWGGVVSQFAKNEDEC